MDALFPVSSYSWNQTDWLNMFASYDRVYYKSTIMNFRDLIAIFQDSFEQFKTSTRTRFVFNVDVPNDLWAKIIESLQDWRNFSNWVLETYYEYPLNTSKAWFSNLILSFNKEKRALSESHLNTIKSKISDILSKNRFDLNEWLQKIKDLTSSWYRFDLKIWAQELLELWEKTFWWNILSLESEISNNDSIIIWLRNSEWILVSVMMVSSSWESTEWATREWFQWKWYIEPLLLVWHAYKNFKDNSWTSWITPIICEARFNRSVKPWILSWMKLSNWILQNHVTIWWELWDKWNIWKSVINWVNFQDLRSFVTMYLENSMYDSDIFQRILDTANI